MEHTSLLGVRYCSVASRSNDALLLIIPDRAVPETRHLAGFVAPFANLRTKFGPTRVQPSRDTRHIRVGHFRSMRIMPQPLGQLMSRLDFGES